MALLGMDIGGTKRVLTVGEDDGTPRRSIRRPMTQSGDWKQDLTEIAEEARILLREEGVGPADPLIGLGVSVPGPADPSRGILFNPPNLAGWRDVPVGPFLQEALSVPTQIESDANAAALAEARFGAGRGFSDFVYLTMSTGVGGGLISDGRLLRGAFGSAGEPGHIPIEANGRSCACGLQGCLEAYVGGNAWRDHLQQVAPESGRVTQLAGGSRDEITPEHLITAAHEGDAFALDELNQWLDHLVRGLVPIVMLLEPKRILLGTIAIAAGDALCFAPLRRKLQKVLWPHQWERLEIAPGGLGEDLPERAGLAVARAFVNPINSDDLHA
jgi:glucokinase